MLISSNSAGLNRLGENLEILVLESAGIVDKILRLRVGSGSFRGVRQGTGIHQIQMPGELYKTTVIGEFAYDPSNE